MLTGYKIEEQDKLYCITLQIVGWIDLFSRQAYRDIVIENLGFVTSVISSISNIASGNIGGAASFIENAIARTIPMILSGLVQVWRLKRCSRRANLEHKRK